MIWKRHTKEFDLDTVKILQIAQDFLIKYYSCDKEEAEVLIDDFLESHQDKLDEDLIHFYSSYRLAGLAYIVIREKKTLESANEILVEKGRHNPPQSAMEYFRENYFEENLDNPFNKPPYSFDS